MKLNDNFLTYSSLDNHYMVSTSNTKFNGIVNSNETAAFIIECLKEETTIDNIVDKIINNYKEASKDIVTNDVINIINKLKEIGAIDE